MADWPDWRGDTAIIVGTGPSAKLVDLSVVRRKAKVIVVNDALRLAPWADVLYASDRSWWELNDGAPKFRGLRVCPSPLAAKLFPSIVNVKLQKSHRIVTEPIGTLGSGSRSGNGGSGFHAVNLAVQFGARRIALVGFDRAQELDDCAEQFKSLGVDVINCSPVSALKNYPKQSLMEALWSSMNQPTSPNLSSGL